MQPEEKFIKKEFLNRKRNDFIKEYQSLGGGGPDSPPPEEAHHTLSEKQEEQKDLLGFEEETTQPTTQGPEATGSTGGDLLEAFSPKLPEKSPLDMLGGNIFGESLVLQTPSISLEPNGKIDPGTFEKLWMTLPER